MKRVFFSFNRKTVNRKISQLILMKYAFPSSVAKRASRMRYAGSGLLLNSNVVPAKDDFMVSRTTGTG